MWTFLKVLWYMKPKFKAIFAVILFVLYSTFGLLFDDDTTTNTASNDQWQWVIANDNSGWLFEQNSFVRTSPNSYSVTIKTHNSEEFNNQETERLKLAKPISYRLSTYVFNFETKQLQLASATVYDENDNILYSVDKPGGWSKINPKTAGEAMFDSTYKYFQKYSGKVKSPPGTAKS